MQRTGPDRVLRSGPHIRRTRAQARVLPFENTMGKSEIPNKLRKRGIYIIRIGTAPDWKAYYVGSTTENFHSRWRRHKSKLRRGTHPNSDLQAFYDEDPNQLHYEVLESMRTKDKVKIENRERHWFNVLSTTPTPIINHQTPRVGKTSKRGRGLRRRRKARAERAAERAHQAPTSAAQALLWWEEDSD